MVQVLSVFVSALACAGAFQSNVGRSAAAGAKRAQRVAPPAALMEAAMSALLLTGNVDAAAAYQAQHEPTVFAKETREGLYGAYEIDVDPSAAVVDDARSNFKTKAQTRKGKNKYAGIFAILLVGSFIIPMAQYFWYVRDTPNSLFSKPPPPPPPPPPKKKGIFDIFDRS
ncbi:hypothetical protein M885DRAFT_548919 [Pelagophyceae sp. CCMP2097]|nr:hypothetical protein M885DRAFT_548919 [Pelagophyceae sp. CCMP2097]